MTRGINNIRRAMRETFVGTEALIRPIQTTKEWRPRPGVRTFPLPSLRLMRAKPQLPHVFEAAPVRTKRCNA